jgi:hypothetical protein
LIPALLLLQVIRNRNHVAATLAAVSTLVVVAGILVLVVASQHSNDASGHALSALTQSTQHPPTKMGLPVRFELAD